MALAEEGGGRAQAFFSSFFLGTGRDRLGALGCRAVEAEM